MKNAIKNLGAIISSDDAMTGNHKKLEILLVEDNKDDAELIVCALDPQRYHIVNVWNGQQALDFLSKDNEIDVVLLDKNMPYKNGLEVLKEAKEKGLDYAFIFLTVDQTITPVVEAMKLGALDFFPKSSGYDGLPAMIEKVCDLHHDRLEKKRVEEQIEASLKEKETLLQELNTERRRLADILDGTNVGTWEWNSQTGETIFNERWAEIIGYTLEELSPVTIETWIKFSHPDDLKVSNGLLEKHFNGELDYYDCEIRMQHKNGDWVWVQDRGKIVTWSEDRKPLLVSGTHQDITVRKQAEEDLKESQEKFSGLYNKMSSGVVFCKAIYDKNGNMSDCIYEDINPVYAGFVNLKKETAIGKKVSEMLPGTEPEWFATFGEVVKSGKPISFEMYHEQSQKNYYVFAYNSKKDAFSAIFDDITARKQAEEQIKANLKEKETLLKEIHHRVKNNMTVISSLLKLQMDRTDNQTAKDALLDSQNRVNSMSMIHQTLYRSDNLAAIDLKTYLSELGKTVFQNYTISNKVQFKVEAENIMIGPKQASPVGLIVNELISNCLKYAFADGREGEILLELKSDKENGVELSISDNGVGLPEGFNLETADSLGLKLIKLLAENQLGGSLDMESENGTKFTIKFDIDQA